DWCVMMNPDRRRRTAIASAEAGRALNVHFLVGLVALLKLHNHLVRPGHEAGRVAADVDADFGRSSYAEVREEARDRLQFVQRLTKPLGDLFHFVAPKISICLLDLL